MMNITYECFMYKHVYILYFNKKRKDKPQEIRLFFVPNIQFLQKKKIVLKNPYLKLFSYVF